MPDPSPDDGSDDDDMGDYSGLSQDIEDSSDDGSGSGDNKEEGHDDEEDVAKVVTTTKVGKAAAAAKKAASSRKIAKTKAANAKKRKAAASLLSGLDSSTRKKKAIERFSPGEKAVRSRIGLGPPSHRSEQGKDNSKEDADATLAREYVEGMTVADIRAALRDRQALVSGRKAVVTERLLDLLKVEREEKKKNKSNVASTKLDLGGEPVSDDSNDVKELIRAMMEQQRMMLQLMHAKNMDQLQNEGPPNISAKKPPPTPQKDATEITTTSLGKQIADRFQTIKPKPSTYVGDHDMALFFRHNLEMAKLIQENAELRQDRLIGDMIRGVHD